MSAQPRINPTSCLVFAQTLVYGRKRLYLITHTTLIEIK